MYCGQIYVDIRYTFLSSSGPGIARVHRICTLCPSAAEYLLAKNLKYVQVSQKKNLFPKENGKDTVYCLCKTT